MGANIETTDNSVSHIDNYALNVHIYSRRLISQFSTDFHEILQRLF